MYSRRELLMHIYDSFVNVASYSDYQHLPFAFTTAHTVCFICGYISGHSISARAQTTRRWNASCCWWQLPNLHPFEVDNNVTPLLFGPVYLWPGWIFTPVRINYCSVDSYCRVQPLIRSAHMLGLASTQVQVQAVFSSDIFLSTPVVIKGF